MRYFAGNTDYIKECKRNGFVPLSWNMNTENRVSGEKEDTAVLKLGRCAIEAVVKLVDSADSGPPYEARVVVTIPTRLGVMSFFNVSLESTYERAIEYAEWQSTLASAMVNCLITNDFDL